MRETFVDKDSDILTVTKATAGRAYVDTSSPGSGAVTVEISTDQAPTLIQAIAEATGLEGWWVEKSAGQVDGQFDVYEHAGDAYVRDVEWAHDFRPEAARDYAAELLKAADEADELKAKAEDPKQGAREALGDLIGGPQYDATDIMAALEDRGYTIVKREDQ